MRAIPKQKLVYSGLFADTNDGLEKEDLNEPCFGTRYQQKA